MSKTFKPMKAPNEQVPGKSVEEQTRNLPLPLIASYKIDGIRCIFKEGKIYSCSLKPIPNVRLHERFEFLKQLSKERNIILDGELYSESTPFNELSGICRSNDKELPDDLSFYCFDMLVDEGFGPKWPEEFKIRQYRVHMTVEEIKNPYFIRVKQLTLTTPEEVLAYFHEAVDWGCDGLILRNPAGKYKYGRGTLNEGLIFKLKPYVTFDAKIIGVLEGTVVRSGAEKKINELGNSVTSKKKADRVPGGYACDFIVNHKNSDEETETKELKVSIAMTMPEKIKVWKDKDQYIGRWIEYKGLLIGAKDLPRHPVFIRFRDDKE